MTRPLHDRAREHILGLSDSELAEYIAAGITLYEPEAIEFARKEFNRRNIDPSLAEQLQAEAIQRENVRVTTASEAAALPLDGGMKFMSFLGGMFITSLLALMLLLFAWHGYRQRGELRRASEMWRFVGYGFGAILLLGFVLTAYLAMRGR
jgi:hypothetical protein